jgi:hypothetical protein
MKDVIDGQTASDSIYDFFENFPNAIEHPQEDKKNDSEDLEEEEESNEPDIVDTNSLMLPIEHHIMTMYGGGQIAEPDDEWTAFMKLKLPDTIEGLEEYLKNDFFTAPAWPKDKEDKLYELFTLATNKILRLKGL